MPDPRRSLLRTRLFPLLFSLAVLPVVGMGAMFYAMSLRSVESVLERQSRTVARAEGTRIAATFPRMKKESGMPARSREVRDFYRRRAGSDPNPAVLRQFVERDLKPYLAWFLAETGDRYVQLTYLDAAGNPVFKYDPAQVSQLESAGAVDTAFTPTDRQGLPAVGELLQLSVQATPNHGLVLRFGRPVRDARAPQQPPGYVLLDVPLTTLLSQRISEDLDLMLVERQSGQVLYARDTKFHGQPLRAVLPDLARALERAGTDTSGSVKFVHQQEDYLASYTHLEQPTWTVVATIAAEPYTAGPRQTGLYTLSVAALFVLLSGLIIFTLVRRVRERTTLLEQVNLRLEEQNVQIQEANLRLEEQNVQIQEATRRKSDFLARMSHDLRTPMNAIIGYARILLRRAKDTLDPRQYRNLENIQISAQNLLGLINDILDLSKVEAGRIDIKPEPVDLKQLAEECAISVESLLQPGVELRRELADVEPVQTDADRLRRVAMNLLSNAVKFTEVGRITIALKPVDGWVELAVADTGAGIPAADLPHIFDEFRQVEGQESTAPEGTGLGLSIAKKSVELLGGTIAVESEVGQGTAFALRIRDYEAPS